MKNSVRIMQQFSGDEQWRLPTEQLVSKIGAQLGAVEEVLDQTHKYDGIKVVDIVEAKPHTNADKLNVYQLFDGQQNVQVVSGDKTLNVGDKVAWLAPGTTVPATFGTDEPFTLTDRDMRGQISHGMFGSGKELAINDDHHSVLKLDTDAPAGTPLADVYKLNDVIIDIENKMFTHRPDGFGQLGVAREVAGIQGLPFQSPTWYQAGVKPPTTDQPRLHLHVQNHIPNLVPRYSAIVLDNIKLAPSPLWLQSQLYRLGVRPINNVVDVTNYIMLLTGQPLHAFDYDKVAQNDTAHVVIRTPKPGEQLTLLDGKTITPYKDAVLICNQHQPLALGGAMGGANSEIDNQTTRIILECATFNMFNIRRTSMTHGIFTDAITRYAKGQSPLQVPVVAARAIALLGELADAQVASNYVDDYQKPVEPQPIVVTTQFINDRLGTRLSAAEVATTLNNVEVFTEESGGQLLARVPFWRTDLQIPEDVVEEVGRLRGFDTLPEHLPTRRINAINRVPLDVFKNQLRHALATAGANELQTYTFVPAKLLQTVGQDPKLAFALRNAISPELEHYRLSITPSLLEKVHPNIKAGFKTFAMFELGKAHQKGVSDAEDLPREQQRLAFVYASDQPAAGAPYYHAKRYLDYIAALLHAPITVVPFQPQASAAQLLAPFEPKRSGLIMVNGAFAGVVGEYRHSVVATLKLPQVSAGFELDTQILANAQTKAPYAPLLKFPLTEQDVCFKVAAATLYAQVAELARQGLPHDERLRVTIAPLDIYQSKNDTAHKQITLRLTLQHHDRTLTTDQVNTILSDMVAHVASVIEAVRI